MNKSLCKTLLFTLAFIALVQMARSLDRPNPAKWVPADFNAANDYTRAIVKTLMEKISDDGLKMKQVESFASRPLMIGREYKTVYSATSQTVS